MTRALLTTLVFGSALQLIAGTYKCPSYDAIVTSTITENVLSDLQGDWYMLATNEPTMPAFVDCAQTTWYLDSTGPVQNYHYDMVTQMLGKKLPAITMKGQARDPKQPGLLSENAALFNHSVAPYVPDMVYDIQKLPDGNTLGFNYACISGSMFSFNMFARRPTLSSDEIKGWIQKQNQRVGGVFNVENMHISDTKKCGWSEPKPEVEISADRAMYDCPSYEKIVSPNVGPNILNEIAGDWYLLATNEPTLPPFCTCGKIAWHLDGKVNGVQAYHYDMASKAFGQDAPVFTMKGEARDPKHPGNLRENMAFFNHSIAPWVPNMIIDKEELPDGNTLGFNYACLFGTDTSTLFSFSVIARRPSVSADQVKAWIQKQNARVGGILDVENMRITDVKKCGWDGHSSTVVV